MLKIYNNERLIQLYVVITKLNTKDHRNVELCYCYSG